MTGTAPNRRFIVEWHNVKFCVNGSAPVTFEAIFDENGTITFGYADIDSTPHGHGGQATVGIENVDGTVALAYSYNQPVLRSGVEVRFLPPGAPAGTPSTTPAPTAKGG